MDSLRSLMKVQFFARASKSELTDRRSPLVNLLIKHPIFYSKMLNISFLELLILNVIFSITPYYIVAIEINEKYNL